MSLIDELKQAMNDMYLINKSGRDKVAHFCEHRDIRIRFSRARSIWHAVTPTAIKPWWLLLEPTRTTNKTHANNTATSMENSTANNKNKETEVIDNA